MGVRMETKTHAAMVTKARRDYETRFKQVAEQPLDKKITGVRLPADIGEIVRSLPNSQRSEWLRRVISEAAKRELVENKLISKAD